MHFTIVFVVVTSNIDAVLFCEIFSTVGRLAVWLIFDSSLTVCLASASRFCVAGISSKIDAVHF